MFGSTNAGDSWNLVMEFLISTMRARLQLAELNYYVDNAVNCTPPRLGRENARDAASEFDRMIDFLKAARVPYHEEAAPSTRVRFLGWVVDTAALTVSLPPERLKWLEQIRAKEIKLSRKLVVSLEGLLVYLAAVIHFLKAPLGWLQRRMLAQAKGTETWDERFTQRFYSYWNYVVAL